MSLILHPEELPVVGIDAHLPPVASDRLHPDALRQRFRSPPAWEPEVRAERRMAGREPAHASVLVPLVMRDELTVLLTRRTEHLRDHAGQISFPGGRAEPHDPDPAATALREAEEEIGLPREHVEVLGTLPIYRTVTAFMVTPVVALVRPGFQLQPDPFEVAEAFEVPLQFLMQPANHRRHAFEFGGERREFFSMPWESGAQRYFIWGATAGMLRNLYRFLSA
ncbi:CoA pyrophosphatase [Caldimonas thermodepolymerans]|jgi:NTP pyrophosphohydrolases including oxidative damage repair enzymes|uniref:8-oxo-dGTP pyrophosphatase MutT (NUDIX family) n=1 Tax=Caldimonas thermodepolymerans TaxID=215580 RepID=A0A2S5T330_9BURK|nr:CoA pyrophosphatase [Caldimonas thermodepolymerans]PPE69390.1 CoA pyrophosphatase [Caldimonas thermodepolymerans]QPC32739.1 CoA pyrophosphatase [Caldimonas thermodepolymerans]RDI03502.1 8-oxo-dGTP pyrophosphatase MutT (NUDIX family) [Caldimonas thermodepolymerans]TCP06639.1 8-oxo-dGTP pyrophosphatase MutT (NUDIX family) [Caldimonas thermodepolymerans]UZG45549.1 CoA pyrophosphatase [Caldimonas thermodepolymerans]